MIVKETGTRLVSELLRNKNKHGGCVHAAPNSTGKHEEFDQNICCFGFNSNLRNYIGSVIQECKCTKWLSTNDGID